MNDALWRPTGRTALDTGGSYPLRWIEEVYTGPDMTTPPYYRTGETRWTAGAPDPAEAVQLESRR
jgi:hypothetical protein